MQRKGILKVYCALLVSLMWVMPAVSAAADESAEEITTMLTWWDEVGSDWEAAGDFIEFAATDSPVPVGR